MPLTARVLAGIIAGGASLASSGLSAGTAFRQQRLANEYNLDMWNRQNAYNTPAEQMRRLQEAGLNPNLMYGQGNVGNAPTAPQFQQLSEQGYKPVDIPSAIQSFQSFTDWENEKRPNG